MTTLNGVCEQTLLFLEGYGVTQSRAAFLSSAIDTDDLTFTVGNATGISEGIAELGGQELVYIASVNRAAGQVTIAPDGRGYRGSTAAAWPTNTRLTINPTFPKQTVLTMLNNIIGSLYPKLWSFGATEFLFEAARVTYPIPTEAKEITGLTWQNIGPSRLWPKIREWSFDANASVSEYPTGKSLTIESGVLPGRTVKVVYKTVPAVGTLTSTLAQCGLQESAIKMLVFGASADLVSFADPSRLNVGSVESDVMDANVQAGIAVQVASQLQKRFQMELEEERKRLLKITGATIHITKGR